MTDLELIIKEIKYGWLDDTHGIHYHHRDDPSGRQQSDGMGDSAHHSFAFWTSIYLLRGLTSDELKIIHKFMALRIFPNRITRHPRTGKGNTKPEIWGRDQCDFSIYGISVALGNGIARTVYQTVKTSRPWYEFFWPNYRVHFARSYNKKQWYGMRLWGDLFNLFGCLLYTKGKDPDNVKSLWFRYVVGTKRYPTFLNKIVGKYIYNHLDPWNAFFEYFSYKHAELRDNPPYIWKLALPAIDKYDPR